MLYSNEEILKALYEILNITKNDLKLLLTVDHPPENYFTKIDKKMSTIKDLSELIQEYESKIVIRTFY